MESTTLKILLVMYTIVVVLDLVITAILYKMSRNKLFIGVMFVWAGTAVNFLVQGFFQDFDWKMYLAFSTGILISWPFLLFAEMALRTPLENKKPVFAASLSFLVLGFLYFLAMDHYVSASLLAAIGIAIPFFYGTIVLVQSKKGRGFILLALLMFLQGVHFLDYPLLRTSEEGAFIGFSIALALVFVLSTFLPGFVLMEISLDTARDLKRMVEERTRSLSKALDQNRLLVNILSHDLATPVTVIGFFMSRLHQEGNPALFSDHGMRAQRSMNSIVDMIAKVKHLQKYGLTVDSLERKPFDVVEVVNIGLNMTYEMMKTKGIESQVVLEGSGTFSAIGDRDVFLNQIIMNLLTNAIKFSHPASIITVRVSSIESMVYVSVEDQGVGIPAEIREKLFDLSQRVTRAGTQREGGTGFGLHLAKTCVQLMGGDLQVESRIKEIDGQSGTTVKVQLLKTAS